MMVDQGYDGDFLQQLPLPLPVRDFWYLQATTWLFMLLQQVVFSVGKLIPCRLCSRRLLAVSLMVGSYIISVKRNYPKGDKFSIKNLLKQLSVSFWALAAVLIVVFGVVGGVFTATESAAVAVIYSLIVSVFIYKGLDWKGVWRVLVECVDTLSIVA